MVVIEFKIPHGLKAKARREGYSLVKYSNQPFYHLRKKNSPKIGKNHHKFRNTMQELKISYRKLNDAEKLALKERRKKEGSTKSDWIQFVREYYRGISRQALKEKRQVKAQNKKDQVNKPQKGIESKNLREMKSDGTCSRSSDFRQINLYSSEVPCLGLRKSGLQPLLTRLAHEVATSDKLTFFHPNDETCSRSSDFRQLIFVRSPLPRAEELRSQTTQRLPTTQLSSSEVL